ncbi:MAG: hypothetical protein IT236_14390 [Bacteroidia bacterium]|nr:hypothetical protein [Bacteroidia bacterium]
MFGFFRKKDKAKASESKTEPEKAPDVTENNYRFKWYDLGPDNPFNKKILDCRGFTETMLSTTSDQSVAISFNQQRHRLGKDLIGLEFPVSETVDCELVYPHNGEQIEGTHVKAQQMEDKWDVYFQKEVIYFVRSWTGELWFKAFFRMDSDKFTVYKVAFEKGDNFFQNKSFALNAVHFLIKTWCFGKIFPHQVPANVSSEMDIALISFSMYGKNCWYATHEDILDAKILPRPSQT